MHTSLLNRQGHHIRLHHFLRTLVSIFFIAAAMIAAAAFAGRFFTWNLTPSLPRGLYMRRPNLLPRRGSVVLLPVPKAARPLIEGRHYLRPDAQLLKVVVALPGDRVCVADLTLLVEGQTPAPIRRADSLGRPLEPVSFCGTIAPGHAFVITPAPLSFDSRYFGPVPLSSLVVVRPLWTF